MKTIVKYTQNRKYRDFVDDEIQEEILKGIRKSKPKSFLKKGINTILEFFKK
jgi:hypothetical protein